MPEYTVYCIDEDSGATNRVYLYCADDLEALTVAYKFCGDHAVEVWQGERQLCVIAKGASMPSGIADTA